MRLKTSSRWLALIGGVVLWLPEMPVFASVQNDQVLSQHIKEADGTSGQNTNSGSGVKTGHIQDGAVTGEKIADTAVTNAKIGANAVTNAKIADGAVTDAKISGTISVSKVPHEHDAIYQKKYTSVVVVSPDGNGDFLDPVSAMDWVNLQDPGPSAASPWLLKIMPGVYAVGDGMVQMHENMDIEGSGERVTRIVGTANSWWWSQNQPSAAVVVAANNTELRAITIENVGTGDYPSNTTVCIMNGRYGTSDFSMRNVTTLPSGVIQNNIGVMNYSILTIADSTIATTVPGGGTCIINGGTLSMTGSRVLSEPTTPGYPVGIRNGGAAFLRHSTIVVREGSPAVGVKAEPASITALTGMEVSAFAGSGADSYAIWNVMSSANSITLDRSTLEGNQTVSDSSLAVRIGGSRLVGAPPAYGTCVDSYDGDYQALGTDCQLP